MKNLPDYKTCRSRSLAILCASFISTGAYGRFSHDDAQEIDADYNFNTETYNDKLSYRLPSRWLSLWENSGTGLRINAGSLTISRFNYEQELKIDPAPLEDISLAFFQERYEDYSEIQNQNELRLGIRLLPWLRLLIMGDGSAKKEYGDMGAGVRFLETQRQHTDFYFWSVDHYYNEKTHEDGSRRQDLSRTYGIRSKGELEIVPLAWKLKYENDLPIAWTRGTGELYQYERRVASLRIEFNDHPSNSYFAQFDRDDKREGLRTIPAGIAAAPEFSIHRQVHLAELGREWRLSEVDYSASLLLIRRDSTWTKANDLSKVPSWKANLAPEDSSRNEIGTYFARGSPLGEKTIFTQTMTVNYVAIKEEPSSWRGLEVKYGTALNWSVAKNGGFGLNATWDLDQLASDFPYRSKNFRPWGGGNIQAQLLF